MGNEGRLVKVHYVGTLDDGTVFESTFDFGEPAVFTCMAGEVFDPLDAAVRDMAVGETRKIRVPASEAFGDYDPQKTMAMPVESFGEWGAPVPGERVWLQQPDGEDFPAAVLEVKDGQVILDMNHELAGQALNFEVTLLEVNR